jgi:hypothetical protein
MQDTSPARSVMFVCLFAHPDNTILVLPGIRHYFFVCFGHCDRIFFLRYFPTTFSQNRNCNIPRNALRRFFHYNPIQRPKTHAYTRHHLPGEYYWGHDLCSWHALAPILGRVRVVLSCMFRGHQLLPRPRCGQVHHLMILKLFLLVFCLFCTALSCGSSLEMRVISFMIIFIFFVLRWSCFLFAWQGVDLLGFEPRASALQRRRSSS